MLSVGRYGWILKAFLTNHTLTTGESEFQLFHILVNLSSDTGSFYF